MTFGSVCVLGYKHADSVDPRSNDWLGFAAGLLASDATGDRILERLKDDRNRFAHGHAAREPDEIRQDLGPKLGMTLLQVVAEHTSANGGSPPSSSRY